MRLEVGTNVLALHGSMMHSSCMMPIRLFFRDGEKRHNRDSWANDGLDVVGSNAYSPVMISCVDTVATVFGTRLEGIRCGFRRTLRRRGDGS